MDHLHHHHHAKLDMDTNTSTSAKTNIEPPPTATSTSTCGGMARRATAILFPASARRRRACIAYLLAAAAVGAISASRFSGAGSRPGVISPSENVGTTTPASPSPSPARLSLRGDERGGEGEEHEEIPGQAESGAWTEEPEKEEQDGTEEEETESEQQPEPLPDIKDGALTTEGSYDDGTDGPNRVVKVYVYDDPVFDNADLLHCYRNRNQGIAPWQDEHHDMAQDMGEVWLHRTLLEHPWRVLDPEDADLFYIPLYPVLSFKLLAAEEHTSKCAGRNHWERISDAVAYLQHASPYFNRYGGADHVVVCAWWNCRKTLGSSVRMILRRTVVGINERLKQWTRWGCPDRTLTVPYTASSVLTGSEKVGGRPAEERDIPFFFVGTARDRPERQNLEVVRELYPDSVIQLGDHEADWGMNATAYAEHMSRSRFCFCPRGDTASSRRIFDAVAAGCIPIITERQLSCLPFTETGLDYSQFVVVTGITGFSTHEEVTAVVTNVTSRSEEDLASLRNGLQKGLNAIVYGVTTGLEVDDMHPSIETGSRFLSAAQAKGGGEHLWSCGPMGFPPDQLAPRTWMAMPPPEESRSDWLAESETLVNLEHSLLFCAPPNTGSLQFRMLAKRMQGVEHWAVSNDRAKLFDPTASELPLLDVENGELMEKIFQENGSGWIKIGVVRDPVTRILSAYLDFVHAWGDPEMGGENGEPWLEPPESMSSHANDGGNQSTGVHNGVGGDKASADDDGEGDDDDEGQRRRRRLASKGRERGSLSSGALPAVTSPVAVSSGSAANTQVPVEGGNRVRVWELSWLEDAVERLWSGRRESTAVQEQEQQQQQQQQRHLQRQSEGVEEGGGIGEAHGRHLQYAELGQGDATSRGMTEAVQVNRKVFAKRRRAASLNDLEKEGEKGGSIPTFSEVVEALESSYSVSRERMPASLRSVASLCGASHSPFDSFVPFETLQKTSTEVLKSLPGDIWETYAETGWGPHGDKSFMSFDYRKPYQDETLAKDGSSGDSTKGEKTAPGMPPPHQAQDLFEGDSCAWTEYYRDEQTLNAVARLYAADFDMFGWYNLDEWRERLFRCLRGRQ